MSRDIEKPDKCNPPLVKPSGPSVTVEPTEVCNSTGISPMPANHSMQGNHSRKRCESSAARDHSQHTSAIPATPAARVLLNPQSNAAKQLVAQALPACVQAQYTAELADLPRAVRFALIRTQHPGWSVHKCSVAAGYSPTSRPAHTSSCRLALASIEEQRRELQSHLPTSLPAVVGRDLAIAESPTAEDKDKLAANKHLATILDYDPDRRVQVRSMSLIAELGTISTDDLQTLLSSA